MISSLLVVSWGPLVYAPILTVGNAVEEVTSAIVGNTVQAKLCRALFLFTQYTSWCHKWCLTPVSCESEYRTAERFVLYVSRSD